MPKQEPPQEKPPETHLEYCGYGGGAGDDYNWTEVSGPDPNQREKMGKLEMFVGFPLAFVAVTGMFLGSLWAIKQGVDYLADHSEELLQYFYR